MYYVNNIMQKRNFDMYTKLHDILADKTGGEVFTCFSAWHFFYIFLVIGTVSLTVYLCRNKNRYVREKVLKCFIAVAFGIYMLDFFLMPFAYGEIDIDKLPFHSCTAMSIMCFLSRNNHALRKYRLCFALLGLLSNLMYLCYPAGVMWYEIHPLSYRAVQTLLFHSVMIMYCALTLLIDHEKLSLKHWYRDLAILGILTVWATLGNALYSGTADSVGYAHDFNWFFVKQDPFYALPADIARYIAPWLNIVAFFALEILIRWAFDFAQKKTAKKNESAGESVLAEPAVKELV